MIQSLALALLGLVVGFIALILTKDLIWLLKSFKYFKQDIPVKYFPFIGFAKYLENPAKEEGIEDFCQLFQKADDKSKSEKILMMNGTTTRPVVFLNDKDLIKEFFQKETKVCYTSNLLNFPTDRATIFSPDQEKVLRDNATFKELFFPENLRRRTPGIRAIAQRHFNRIKAEMKKSGAKNKDRRLEAEIELRPYMKDLFNDMVSYVIFGGEIPELEGAPLANLIDKVAEGFFKNYSSPLHIATLGLSTRLGLDFEYNQVKKLFRRIINKVKEVIIERENEKDREFGCNVIDLMIQKNREREAQGQNDPFDYEEIAQGVFGMVFAGTGTTRSLTEASIYKLSTEPELQKQFREIARNQVLDTGNGEDYDKYENCAPLAAFMKEALRVIGPTGFGFQRLVLKNFKLGGKYTIGRGDVVLIPIGPLMLKPEFFKDGNKFDLKKYEEKRRISELSKSVLIPFSAGKRSCLGRNLASITFKLILSNFLDQFELSKSAEPNRRFIQLAVGMKHCKVNLSCLE